MQKTSKVKFLKKKSQSSTRLFSPQKKKKIYKNTIEFILCWPSATGHGSCLKCGLYTYSYKILKAT